MRWEGTQIADTFNCKLGKFSMKYLGLPISDKRLTKLELSEAPVKTENRIAAWKCSHLSYGGNYSNKFQLKKYSNVYNGFLLAA